MGSDKALLPWRGSTFLAAAIEALRPHTQIILVVAGKNADGLSSLVYAAGADLARAYAAWDARPSSFEAALW